jgi:hypothetical protein
MIGPFLLNQSANSYDYKRAAIYSTGTINHNMNIINLSLLLANAAILASASATATAPNSTHAPAPKTSNFSVITDRFKSATDSVANYMSNLKSNPSASSSPQTGTFSNEADKIFKNVKNKVGAFSDMVSTSAENTLNSLSSKAVNKNEPVKLDRIMACKATGSKDDFIKAIKAYANFVDKTGTPSATSGDASIIDPNDENSSKKNSTIVDTAAPNENASSTKDTKLKPYDLALKKLIVLFNCPKSNALLAELTEAEMKFDQNQIPDIVKVALKQKLLEFPFGSLQVDYDRTLEKCVKSINYADHGDICQNAPCTEDDVKKLEEKLVNLEYCSHHFIQDSIKKIAVEVLKNEQVKKLGNNDNGEPDLKFTLRRPQLLEIIKKIANTLPRIQMGTGNFVNQNLLEKTTLKCRANLQKLLGISEPDVPSYDYLFTEVKADSAGADGAGVGAGDGVGAVNGDDLKKPATDGATPSDADANAGVTPIVTDASATPVDTSPTDK